MRRRGEQRLVEHILPIARELALGDDPGIEHVAEATMAHRDDSRPGRDCAGRTARQRRQSQLPQRQDEAEARGVVESEGMSRYDGAVDSGEPDRFRLGDEVADCEKQAVLADEDGVA